ncbi:MAG: hypothetical protein KKD21_02370 [Proteobacteria bacterium]|nr:hypothetical protein [Pseudomonadota bacterium]MBU1695873.1 hypothetical protein [Pseudomonadota bacterium]
MHPRHRADQKSFSQLTEQVRESFFGIQVINTLNFEKTIWHKSESASTDFALSWFVDYF